MLKVSLDLLYSHTPGSFLFAWKAKEDSRGLFSYVAQLQRVNSPCGFITLILYHKFEKKSKHVTELPIHISCPFLCTVTIL